MVVEEHGGGALRIGGIRRVLVIAAVLLLAVVLGLAALFYFLSPRLSSGIAAALSDQTGRPVQLSSFGFSLWPVSFRGRGLVIGPEAEGGPPLAVLDEFSVEASWSGLLEEPRRIETLKISGLDVRISRKPAAAPHPGEPEAPPQQPEEKKAALPVVIERVEAEEVRVEIASDRPDKPPRLFEIERLELDSLDLRRPVSYRARLRYQRPPGDLEVEGSFGPVAPESPERTPYSGRYDFRRADLAVFGGIAGMLDTRGEFEGTVGDTRVGGEASIPDFLVTRSQNVVPLEVRYQARVRDNGRIIELVSVETRFEQSELETSGEVSRVPDREGRVVRLDVSSEQARVEDLIAFAVASDEPPLTGDIRLDTRVEIPPGEQRFIERMTVEGEFHIREGRFSNLDIQGTLEKISSIGSGTSEAEAGETVVSDMRGRFRLEDSKIDFSRLNFSVPGMAVELTGTYVLEGEQLDFRGRALLERAPSEMAPDSMSRWLRILDPILRGEKAGTVLPIEITGTRSAPSFRVDYKRLIR